MSRYALLLMTAAVLASAQLVEQPSTPKIPPDQRAKRVIDDAVAALGGEKFLAMADRSEIGRAYSFYNDQLTGLSIAKIYTRYQTVERSKSGHDLAVKERQVFGKKEDTSVVLTEDGGFNLNWRGAKPLTAQEFARYRESALRNLFYILRQRLREPGLTFESRAAEVVDHQPVEVVDIIDSENRVVTAYFHQTTKLPVKQYFMRMDPKTRDRTDEVTYYARYRTNDGIQWPQEITRERNGEKIYQIFAETVRFNQDLTDDLFTAPPPAAPTTPVKPKPKK